MVTGRCIRFPARELSASLFLEPNPAAFNKEYELSLMVFGAGQAMRAAYRRFVTCGND